jgi:hypothetical protein
MKRRVAVVFVFIGGLVWGAVLMYVATQPTSVNLWRFR